MDGYTLLGLKLAMGIIGLVLQINLMGKVTLHRPPRWIRYKTMC